MHALFGNRVVLEGESELRLDTAEAIAGAIWRIGDAAIPLVSEGRPIPAAEALKLGLCDGVAPHPALRATFSPRGGEKALIAVRAAADLISRRGGDALERATFAWLFATGVPREGLTAFLEKRPPRF